MRQVDGASTSPTVGQSSAPAAANAVTIKNFAFSPAKLTVKAGTKVTWTNTDPDTHTVTSKQGSGWPLKQQRRGRPVLAGQGVDEDERVGVPLPAAGQ
ncbi:cupredoxin domain-containing protein [Streptomyces sp. BE133]|uniref:cupredoxin domain-containing protein n=1 Tax=Streptomyces sp. BE133 TaxID=3002523 RepID=UPI002E769481|nr:cupredoxin domain-containing protein [Streptomyces sp. BE133]MEE1805921.1 cupredoxin domain-containing protein [Streptomyces sp. BE133]